MQFSQRQINAITSRVSHAQVFIISFITGNINLLLQSERCTYTTADVADKAILQ